jgi:sugar phosphate permease
MLLGLTAACLVLWIVGGHSVGLFAVGLGLVGFMLYGPDSLLSGAGAIDLGSREGAIAAAGIINGMGSVGSVVQELVIGRMYERSGGRLAPIFLLLLGAAGIAALCVGLVLWRTRRGKSDL